MKLIIFQLLNRELFLAKYTALVESENFVEISASEALLLNDRLSAHI